MAATGLTVYYFTYNKQLCNQESLPKEKSEQDDNNKTIELSQDEEKIFNALMRYSKEIYQNKGYENFSKNEQGVYVATILDLKNLGYDLSVVDKNCSIDSEIIYFDIDRVLADNYDDMPIQVVLSCE